MCQMIIKKQIAISMTQQMVQLSWGKPNNVDQKEITAKGSKFRWVYGIPRQNARYVWFKDGHVVKIKT